MNDEDAKQLPEKVDEKEAEQEDKGNNKKPLLCHLFSWFTLVLVLALAYGSYYLWTELQGVKQELATAESSGKMQNEATLDNLSSIQTSLNKLKQKQAEQSDLISSLYQDTQKTSQSWVLAEVEYLLVIAMNRLLLERDVATALAALESADQRLKEEGNPGLIPVREQLARDMNQLRNVNLVDVTGMALYLADIVSISDDLPLKPDLITDVNPTSLAEHTDTSDDGANNLPQELPWWKRIPNIIWDEIKSLVVIKRSGEVKPALLLPGEESFLYLNLKLQLESARLSVLRLDEENLHAAIDFIQPWMQQYFDSNDASVINVMETLEQMKVVELERELPDISASLEQIRAYAVEASVSNESTTEIIKEESQNK